MFNRLRKKKEDKNFLCPSCMQSFATVQEMQVHYEDMHGDEDANVTEDQGEGFLCPVCKKSLASPEVLQFHYDAEHNEDASIPDSSYTWNGEITGGEITELRKKLELLQSQLRGSEESRTLLSSEVFHSEQKVTQFNVKLQTLQAEIESLKSTAAVLVGENSILKVKVEECEGQKSILEYNIKTLKRQLDDKSTIAKNLEIQLAQRPEADILVLKQELKSAEAMIDRLTHEREKEKDGLEKEYNSVKAQYNKKKTEVETLAARLQDAPKSEDILRLQMGLNESESGLKDMRATIARLEADLAQARDNKQKLEDQLSQVTDEANQGQHTLIQLQEELSRSGEEMRTLHSILLATQNDLLEAQVELAKTRNRLDQSSRSLEEHVSNISHLQAILDEREEVTNQAQRVTEKAKETIEELKTELEAVKTVLNDKTKELDDHLRLVGDSQSSSQSAILEKDQQIREMEFKVEKLQADLNIKCSELSDLDKELIASCKVYENERHQHDELKAHLLEQEIRLEQAARKQTQLKEKVKDLEAKVTSLSDEKHRLESERHNLVNKIDAGDGANVLIQQMEQENNSLQEKLSSLESTLQTQSSEHFSKEEILHKQIRELKGQLQESETNNSKLETVLEKKSTKLKTVQLKLLEAESDSIVKKELLLTSEAAKTSQRVELSSQLKTVTMSLEKTSSQLTATKSQLDQVNKDVAAKKEKISQLDEKLHDQKEKLFQSKQKVNALDRELQEKSSRLAQLEVDKKELEDVTHANKQTIIDIKGKLMNTEQDLEAERRSKAAEVSDLSKKLEKIIAEKADRQHKLHEMNSNLSDMERKYSEKDKQLESVNKELSSAQFELKENQEMLVKTRENSDDQLVYLTSQFEKERSKAGAAKDEFVRQVASLTEERNSQNQEKAVLLNQILSINQQFQQKILESDKIKGQLDTEKVLLQGEVRNLQKSLEEAMTGKDAYKKDAIKLNNLLEMEQEEKQQKLATLGAARDWLLQQKMEIESQFLKLQVEAEQWTEQLCKVKSEADGVQKALRQENSTLLDKLTTQLSAFETLRKEKDEIEIEFEVQSTLLSNNLTTVRTDLTVAEANLEEMTRVNDQLQGEKLELQAKLERSNDERRILVERCMSSETECEKLLESLAEQKYKLEDIQGALQELGRENQTLQITTTKVQCRKWTDDTDVTDCTSCGKIFSVTNRKHHCRNCGLIFCNECSSKISQIPMVRKPARVCELCFRELRAQNK